MTLWGAAAATPGEKQRLNEKVEQHIERNLSGRRGWIWVTHLASVRLPYHLKNNDITHAGRDRSLLSVNVQQTAKLNKESGASLIRPYDTIYQSGLNLCYTRRGREKKTSQRGFGSSRRVETRSAAYRSTSLMRRCRARFTDLELIQPRYKRWTDAFLCPSPPPPPLYLLVWENTHSNIPYVFVQAFTCTYTWKIRLQTLPHPLPSVSLTAPVTLNPPPMKLFHMPCVTNSNQAERSVAAELTAATTCGAARASSVCSEPPFLTPGV